MNRVHIATWLIFLLVVPMQSQKNINELEEKKRSVQEQIELTNKLLRETNKSVSSQLNTLQLVGKQINSRKKVIDNLSGDISKINKEQVRLESNISTLERDLTKRKERYAKAMQTIWSKNSTVDNLLFILSAESLTQTIRRARYMNEYAGWLRMQGEEILVRQHEIERAQLNLNTNKKAKVTLLSEQEKERKKLQTEEKKEKKVYNDLSRKKKDLQANLSKQQRQATELNRQIQRIIQEEARKSAQSTSTDGGSRTPSRVKDGYAMTKEEIQLSGDFARNQGKLPMPLVGKYILIGRYGQQAHAVLRNVSVNNSGIDLQTESGTDACVVFGGVVSKVFKMQGYGSSVIVRHGNYLTVYSNLSQVYVKAGSKVTTRQAIGKIYTDVNDGDKTVLHFQLWKELSKQNPESWLNM